MSGEYDALIAKYGNDKNNVAYYIKDLPTQEMKDRYTRQALALGASNKKSSEKFVEGIELIKRMNAEAATYVAPTPGPTPTPKPTPAPVITKPPKVGGNTSTQTQSATTATDQRGEQSQGTEQDQRNDSNQSMQGQGNVALVVTPNAESNQQLESQAFGSASQTQQVEVASQADASSAMTNEQTAHGASYTVAPVINIDAADSYAALSGTETTRTFAPSAGSSTAVLIAAAVVAALYLLSRAGAKGKKKQSNTRRRKNV